MGDPRESSSYSVAPRIRYNTIGGVNGPLVIVENVRLRRIQFNYIVMLITIVCRSNFHDTTKSLH